MKRLKLKLKLKLSPTGLLRLAASCSLVGLALMVWSLLDPRPIPIMAAMSVGQAIGTLSFAIFLGVVVFDAWRASRRTPPTDEGDG